ncbi:hypothetical protein OIU34_22300 [Pararhizobium sp. BT-229]|uniref:hypothetical protein n=1 Tax=Pararhizobium sp. BT-229 TaxID=2986923 RepID=UPI0021F72E8A|nr:hypothetical protein [Pararhizobium sp. BT-229]MCV9964626.1 hypothetical protein [Pararhizobium sp. BT-229]
MARKSMKEQPMTRDEAHKIVTQALFLISKDKPDAELFNSPTLFGDFLFHALRTMYSAHEVTRTDTLEVRVNRKDDENSGAIMSFARLFEKLGKTPGADRKAQLVEMVMIVGSNAAGSLSEESIDLTKVLPIVRSAKALAETLERNRARAAERGLNADMSEIIHWKVNDELAAVLAIPQQDSFLFVTEDMRVDGKVSIDELRETAMTNLRREYLAARPGFHRIGSITEIAKTGGAASSFILLDGFLDKLARKGGGDLLVYSGDTDHLVIIPTSNQTSAVKALSGYATGKLPVGEIPQMIYSDGELRPVTRDDVLALMPRVLAQHGSGPARHH